MWTFKEQQKKITVGNVSVGGIPGERPTVLVGSMFYHKQKLVTDEAKGEFDRKRAEEVINRQQEFSEKTGNPCMIDVVGSTAEAMSKFLDFVAGVTDAPIFLDGVSAGVRIASLDYVKQSGLTDRVVYNSINPEFKPAELEKIKETKIKSAVLLAFNTKDFTSRGRINAIEMLLPKAKEAGIEQPLIDTCVIDIPSLGMACRAFFDLKSRFGWPVGCGAHNAIGSWMGLKKKMGEQARRPCVATASALTVAVGADFVLYGPIETAEYLFPAIALVDAAYAQLVLEGGKMVSRNHPIFKIA